MPILRDDLQPILNVDISYESIEHDLNWRKLIVFKRYLNDSEIIKLLQALELSIVDLKGCYNLTVKESQSLDLGAHLTQLFSDESEPNLFEGNDLVRLRLDLECLTLRKREIVPLDGFTLKLNW